MRSCMQLRYLVRWGLGDVEEACQHAAPFQLLRAVIARQIVLPEVYDAMRQVQSLMVRAQVWALSMTLQAVGALWTCPALLFRGHCNPLDATWSPICAHDIT